MVSTPVYKKAVVIATHIPLMPSVCWRIAIAIQGLKPRRAREANCVPANGRPIQRSHSKMRDVIRGRGRSRHDMKSWKRCAEPRTPNPHSDSTRRSPVQDIRCALVDLTAPMVRPKSLKKSTIRRLAANHISSNLQTSVHRQLKSLLTDL